MVGLRTHRARALVAVAAVAAVLGAVTGRAATRHDPWTVTSPDGALSARVGDHGGALSLSVRRHGRQVLAATLGPGSLHAAHAGHDSVDESYATPAGKRRRHELSARRLTITFPGGRAARGARRRRRRRVPPVRCGRQFERLARTDRHPRVAAVLPPRLRGALRPGRPARRAGRRLRVPGAARHRRRHVGAAHGERPHARAGRPDDGRQGPARRAGGDAAAG